MESLVEGHLIWLHRAVCCRAASKKKKKKEACYLHCIPKSTRDNSFAIEYLFFPKVNLYFDETGPV